MTHKEEAAKLLGDYLNAAMRGFVTPDPRELCNVADCRQLIDLITAAVEEEITEKLKRSGVRI